MRTAIIISLILLSSCKTWHWGETIEYKIPKGKHADVGMPTIIDGTKKWGGEMTLEYDPEEMVDPEHNFAYWNKLGGIMPDLTDNIFGGSHRSARIAWRVDPEDPYYFYIGYIVYIQGIKEPYRNYLLDEEGNKVRIPVGDSFVPMVTQYTDHWGVYVKYNGQEARKRFNDSSLKKEKFLVVMDPYYGGVPVAPTDIYITLTIIDTTWLY